MVLYEEIVRAKFATGPGHRLELERLERGRKYGERILSLETSVRELEGRLQELERMLAGLGNKYHLQVTSSSVPVRARPDGDIGQITEVDQALRRYKEDMAKVLEEMCSSARTRYDVTSELGIYGHLLTYEETRLRSDKTEVHRVTVRDSVSRQTHRTSVLLPAEQQISASSSSHTRRESGYFSPESRSRSRTPETFLDNTEASASSDYRSGGSRHFNNIRDDVFTE